MNFLNAYLSYLEMPLRWLVLNGNIPDPPLVHWIYDVIATLLIISIFSGTISSVKRRVRRVFKPNRLLDRQEMNAELAATPAFTQAFGAGADATSTIATLKQSKDYVRLGEVYSSLNRAKEAAKYFKKGGKRREAALEWAKAGQEAKAAKLLMKTGDFPLAGTYFAEAGKFKEAARAYLRAGDLGNAAANHGKSGRFAEAVAEYMEYFKSARDGLEVQIMHANACLDLLESPPGRANIRGEQRQSILPYLASRFEQAKSYDVAARLFVDAGDFVRGGEVYVLAGNLQEAAQCMKKAGKDKEAASIAGRYYESLGKWRDAGLSYAASGDYLHAGECYARAAEAVRAAECFEKASAFYRAGLAYAHATQFQESVRVLQRIREDDKTYDQSRALLGRCFYELHDYAHCAAALDNHLTGKRVDSTNMEYFYMLALAFEQLGELKKSQDLLYKIGTVNQEFRDISQRLSNIASRISIQRSQSSVSSADAGTIISPALGAGSAANTAIMDTVERSLAGRYHLEKELGRGGMGVVYLARDMQLDRPVALKFLGSLIDNSEEYRERFVREAKAAAKISHPNIISIYDISASIGKAYIAMEYVDGPNLHHHTQRKGRLEAREAVNIIGQACAALSAIHEAGITHRDIKPDNILLAKGGLVKLTDFGLAKAEDARITQAGTIMGTPSYMSPEQVMGNEADARSDIYSLGLVLHETLTGKTVFRDGDILDRQLNEVPPPPSTIVEGISPELDRIVMKCIEKKPEQRYPTAKVLLTELRALAK